MIDLTSTDYFVFGLTDRMLKKVQFLIHFLPLKKKAEYFISSRTAYEKNETVHVCFIYCGTYRDS